MQGSARSRVILGAFVLAVLVALPYAQLRDHEFVHFDDYGYIVDNPHVNVGLSSAGLAWAFTTHHMANWHPLTWISHMLDCEWFGLDPGAHHLMGVGLHLINAVLLFVALWTMTRETAPSLVVAALFALHPLRVESVAWASERKDLLAGLFWMLAMLAWVAYARRPGAARYLGVCACLAAGLLAKPMLVTLPLALLLIDYWPLQRLRVDGAGRFPAVSLRRAVIEKIPLLAIAALSAGATILAQSAGGAVQELAGLSLAARVGNAAVSYVAYLWKTVWPTRLAFYYPHTAIVADDGAASLVLPAIAAGVVLFGVSVLAVRFATRAPQFVVGWLWYVATLFPVIGIVQVGNQAMADRYTYIPLVGIYLAVVWTLRQAAHKRPYLRSALTVATVAILAGLAVTTSLQARTWRDSETLFEHALAVTDDNYVAHVNLGNVLARRGDRAAAETHYREALQIEPDQVEAHHNLAGVLLLRADTQGAISHYREALRLRPDYVSAHLNLGVALDRAATPQEAMVHYERAARLDPTSYRAQELLAGAMARIGDDSGAAQRYRRAIELRPGSPATLRLAWLLATSPDAEVRDAPEALALANRCAQASGLDDPWILTVLAAAAAEAGRFDEARRWQARAVELAPETSRELFETRLQLYRDGLPLREGPDERAVIPGDS